MEATTALSCKCSPSPTRLPLTAADKKQRQAAGTGVSNTPAGLGPFSLRCIHRHRQIYSEKCQNPPYNFLHEQTFGASASAGQAPHSGQGSPAGTLVGPAPQEQTPGVTGAQQPQEESYRSKRLRRMLRRGLRSYVCMRRANTNTIYIHLNMKYSTLKQKVAN